VVAMVIVMVTIMVMVMVKVMVNCTSAAGHMTCPASPVCGSSTSNTRCPRKMRQRG
jgi:hypothetical protein